MIELLGMNELGVSTVRSLRDAGWSYSPAQAQHTPLTPALQSARLDFVAWISSFSLLMNSDETVWFLSRDDFFNDLDTPFPWDAFRALSLESAQSGREVAAVKAFWARHLPILLSVRDGYAYLAVRDDGAIVLGGEPEFEDATVVFESLSELLTKISSSNWSANDVVRRFFVAL